MADHGTTDNIYFLALEFGAKAGMQGVAYNELAAHLKQKGHALTPSFQAYFVEWFFYTFYQRTETKQARRKKIGQGGYANFDPNDAKLDHKCILTGEAYLQYIDILELVQAREASKGAERHAITALNWAKIALWVSVAAAVLASVLNAYQIWGIGPPTVLCKPCQEGEQGSVGAPIKEAAPPSSNTSEAVSEVAVDSIPQQRTGEALGTSPIVIADTIHLTVVSFHRDPCL